MATLGEILLTPTRIYAKAVLAARSAARAVGLDLHGVAHITGGGLPGNVPRALPDGLAARLDPASWAMPSVMRLFGALGGLDDAEVRAIFNGGLGMVIVLPGDAVAAATEAIAAFGIEASVVGEVTTIEATDGARYVEGPLEGAALSGRIAVGVSGAGSNLRALASAAGRGELGGEIVLVFADRACPALDWAAEQGIETALVPGGDDATLAETLAAVGADAVVLAGLHADRRAGGPGGVRRADPQHAPIAAAGVPGRSCRALTRWRMARP